MRELWHVPGTLPRTQSKCSVNISMPPFMQTNNQKLYIKSLIFISLCWLYEHLESSNDAGWEHEAISLLTILIDEESRA